MIEPLYNDDDVEKENVPEYPCFLSEVICTGKLTNANFQQEFERLHGVRKIAEVVKSASVDDGVRSVILYTAFRNSQGKKRNLLMSL